MEKIIKVNAFGVVKITDEAIKSIEGNVYDDSPKLSMQKLIKESKKTKSGNFIAIDPISKEVFTFIPIIDGNQLFGAKFPDPIQLYFSLAYSNFQFANQTRTNITLQKNQEQPLNLISPYLYNWHLQYKISTIIFLHSTVEAFINYLMPEDFVYRYESDGKKSDNFLKQIKEYSKEQTERYVQFKEKLNFLIPQLTQIDFQKNHQRIYDGLLEVNTLRNDIIHLRSVKQDNQQYFEKVFANVLNVDLEPYINHVQSFINLIKPGFIEFEEISNSNSVPEFEFRFESYSAFKMDITVFIQIMKVKASKLVLIIPKSTDKEFQFVLNWIMQNLDVLAKEQLIYFPSVQELDDRYLIKITKTENQVIS